MNAERWSNVIAMLGFGKHENIIFSAGTGNLKAKGSAVSDENIIYADKDIDIYVENQDFGVNGIILLPENIKINNYPIRKHEYQNIKNNPFGIITVDGKPYYMSEIRYKRQKNTASFVLIPKKV
jgi:hypothetical protein